MTGFKVLPRRWVVERTFAWLGRNRRLAKDFEATIASAEAWLMIASIQLLTRRIASFEIKQFIPGRALRETWERLVEEVLLYRVVERFGSDVKTQSLKGVVVDDDDYKTIFWAMKRASERFRT